MNLRSLATRSLFAAAVTAAVLAAAATASGAPRLAGAVDHLVLSTKQVAVPVATAPKPKPKRKPPLCKKGQKPTKKKPCRRRKPQAAASAANPPTGGWTLGMTVFQVADGTWSLAIAYNHVVGNARESHIYLFSLSADAVSAAQDLSTLTIDTGTQMGQFGSVRLSLTGVTALAPANPFRGCSTGTWQMRSGTLTGTVTFTADGTYFKTVVLTALPADVSANTSGVVATCGTPPPTCSHSSVVFSGGGTDAPFFEAFSNGTATTMLFFRTQKSAPATITDFVQATGLPAADVTLASDLSTGSVATDGAGPSFTGTLGFARTGSTTSSTNSACGGTPSSFAQGTASGTLVVHFLVGGDVPAPLAPATAEVF